MQRKTAYSNFPKIDRYGIIAEAVKGSRSTVKSVLLGQRSAETALGGKILRANAVLAEAMEKAVDQVRKEFQA